VINKRLRKIIKEMIMDIKTSADVLRRDYLDDPRAVELSVRLVKLYEDAGKIKLAEKYAQLENTTISSFVERYVYIKNCSKSITYNHKRSQRPANF
jgi:hypothetical protein